MMTVTTLKSSTTLTAGSKKAVLAIALCLAAGVCAAAPLNTTDYLKPTARASAAGGSASWKVDVTLNYLGTGPKLVMDVPVLSFTVDEGDCVEGATRTHDMIPEPVEVTQKICVRRLAADRTQLVGHVFPTQPITDAALPDENSTLNYGTPMSIETDGDFVRFNDGNYTIVATKLAPGSATPAATAHTDL